MQLLGLGLTLGLLESDPISGMTIDNAAAALL